MVLIRSHLIHKEALGLCTLIERLRKKAKTHRSAFSLMYCIRIVQEVDVQVERASKTALERALGTLRQVKL